MTGYGEFHFQPISGRLWDGLGLRVYHKTTRTKLNSHEWSTNYWSGWWLTYPSEKYEFVNGKDDIPYIMEKKKCSKPPTSDSTVSWVISTLVGRSGSSHTPLVYIGNYLSRKENPSSAARNMKRRCWDTRLGSASSLCEDVCRRSCVRSPWQVLCRSCCARSLCKDICTRCL